MIDNDDPYGMKNSSTRDLIRTICGRKEDAEDHQAAKIELKRREMVEQHEFNNKLVERQHELNLQILDKQAEIAKKSATIGLIGVIAGTVLGTVLTLSGQIILSKVQSPTQKVSTEQSSPHTIEKTPVKSLSKEDRDDIELPVTKEKSGLKNSYEKPR